MRQRAQLSTIFLVAAILAMTLPSTATATPNSPTCPEDVNNDGQITVTDITLVGDGWGGSDPILDVNGDGNVTIADIQQVAGKWMVSCPAVAVLEIGHIDEAAEYIRIDNNGSAAQDMTGWWIQSYRSSDCTPLADQIYRFPSGYTLSAGASVRVRSGSGAFNNPPTDLLWTTDNIWNNAGDIGDLRDASGNLIDRYAYGSCR